MLKYLRFCIIWWLWYSSMQSLATPGQRSEGKGGKDDLISKIHEVKDDTSLNNFKQDYLFIFYSIKITRKEKGLKQRFGLPAHWAVCCQQRVFSSCQGGFLPHSSFKKPSRSVRFFGCLACTALLEVYPQIFNDDRPSACTSPGQTVERLGCVLDRCPILKAVLFL